MTAQRNATTPGATGTTGQAAANRDAVTNSPAFQQMARSLGYNTQTMSTADWLDVRYHLVPTAPLPDGVHVENGHVVDNPNTAGTLSKIPFWAGVALTGGLAAPVIISAVGGGAAAAGGTAATTGATVGGTTAAAGGTMGTLGTINTLANIAGTVAPILTSAAGSAQTQNNTQNQQGLSAQQIARQQQQFALDAPQQRLRTGLAAALGLNAGPASVSWGGPGSGAKGQVPTYSGGILDIGKALQDPSQRSLMQSVLANALSGQQNNTDSATPFLSGVGQSSTGDNILGGAALTSSLLPSVLALLQKKGASGVTQGGSTPDPNGVGTLDANGNPLGY